MVNTKKNSKEVLPEIVDSKNSMKNKTYAEQNEEFATFIKFAMKKRGKKCQ